MLSVGVPCARCSFANVNLQKVCASLCGCVVQFHFMFICRFGNGRNRCCPCGECRSVGGPRWACCYSRIAVVPVAERVRAGANVVKVQTDLRNHGVAPGGCVAFMAVAQLCGICLRRRE